MTVDQADIHCAGRPLPELEYCASPQPWRPKGNRFALVRRLMRRCYGVIKLLSSPRNAFQLKTAAPGSTLHRLLAGSTKASDLAGRPFVCAQWPAPERLERIIAHCSIIDALGPPFCLADDEFVEILHFGLGDDRCRLTLDRPSWFAREGLLTASLWVEIDRVVSISFCLSTESCGRTAYIGGIQGRRASDSLEQNRRLTKSAHGMRPTDLAFELFRSILPRLGVDYVKCVSNAERYQRTRQARLTIPADDRVLLDYDELWRGRGGTLEDDGFFEVPAIRCERPISDIPARKRSLYRHRYSMLSQLEADITKALKSDLPVAIHRSR